MLLRTKILRTRREKCSAIEKGGALRILFHTFNWKMQGCWTITCLMSYHKDLYKVVVTQRLVMQWIMCVKWITMKKARLCWYIQFNISKGELTKVFVLGGQSLVQCSLASVECVRFKTKMFNQSKEVYKDLLPKVLGSMNISVVWIFHVIFYVAMDTVHTWVRVTEST